MMHSHCECAHQTESRFNVLILVVMDDALALELFGEESSGKTVLILVVMDDALALRN